MTGRSIAVAALLMCGWVALFSPPSVRRLSALGPGRPRDSLLGKAILGGVAAVVLLAVVGVTVTALAFGAGAVVGWAVTRARDRQAATAMRAAVVGLLRAVAGELRSGRPAGAAFAAAVELADPRLRAAVGPLAPIAARGDPAELSDLVREIASTEPGLIGLSRFAACWQVAASSGAALAPAIDRVADALHDELDFAESLAAALAAPRATVRLLAVLPLVGLVLGAVLGARPLAFLFGAPAGWCCLVVAIGFDAAGVFWSRRIARRAALGVA